MDGLLIIDKPQKMTSHDVVNVVRKTLHTKKVGHAGTLDPDATGVLVICVNKATKALQFLSAESKEYITTLSLGQATDTYDGSGQVIETKPFTGYDHLDEVVEQFTGDLMQTPPMYSAIKVHGKKLYEYAREGKSVQVEPRRVHIDEIEVLHAENNLITMRIACSKGTYIRSLCNDMAKALGYPGHMSALRRIRSGDFRIEDAVSLEALQAGDFTLMPLEEAFKSFDRLVIDDDKIAINGRLINKDSDHQVAVYNKEGKILAIYGPDGKGHLKSLRGLF